MKRHKLRVKMYDSTQEENKLQKYHEKVISSLELFLGDLQEYRTFKNDDSYNIVAKTGNPEIYIDLIHPDFSWIRSGGLSDSDIRRMHKQEIAEYRNKYDWIEQQEIKALIRYDPEMKRGVPVKRFCKTISTNATEEKK